MNIFNRILPWFIPTRNDQREWYQSELKENPKEVLRLLEEFNQINERYNHIAALFEDEISKSPLYPMYLDMRSSAQKASFLWQRIEYKKAREVELQNDLRALGINN